MYVKGVLLAMIESMELAHHKPILNFKPFESFLQHHLRRAKDKVSELDRGLKEAIGIHYPHAERFEAMKQCPEIIQTIEEEVEIERRIPE